MLNKNNTLITLDMLEHSQCEESLSKKMEERPELESLRYYSGCKVRKGLNELYA